MHLQRIIRAVSDMEAPRRVVVVDDNALVLRLVHEALPEPEFQLFCFQDSREALFQLHQIQPDLILSDLLMPGMDGREFFQLVKRSPELRQVPFVYLSSVHSNEEIVAALDGGADDFVSKPVSLPRLQAKVRAVLRLADRGGPADRRLDRLTGPVGDGGTLPLIRFCEDSRLSGRLQVVTDLGTHWAEFRGGELLRAGAPEGDAAADPVDALLALRHGRYEIEQKHLDAERLEALRASAGSTPPPPGPQAPNDAIRLPGGRLSRIDVRGEPLEVQTEAENRPNLLVTTIISRGGRVVRKIESSWTHPLQRREDEDPARQQLERQHERVLASVRGLAGARALSAAAPVDAGLLACAASFLAELVRDRLGTVLTATLLRRSLARVQGERPALGAFAVESDGRVISSPDGASLPQGSVGAVAAWLAMFMVEAGERPDGAGLARLRAATRMLEADLERLGFYAALGAALSAVSGGASAAS